MLGFLILKYLSLGLNAARALLLAALLGPESFGLLGTLVVIQQYLSYAALGMREGVTVRLARPESPSERRAQIQSSALAWGTSVGLLVACTIPAWAVATGRGQSHWAWVGIVSGLSIVNEILINIHRDQGRLKKIALLEIGYNGAPLACALWFGSRVSVTLVLQSLAAGLVLSIAGYLIGSRELARAVPRAATIRRLLELGMPLAIASFFASSLTTVYILFANEKASGTTIGLVVLANSICSIVLFGSNMVAWAATSRSMRQLSSAEPPTADRREHRIGSYLRLAVVGAALLLALSGFAFAAALPAYRGAESYALMFCLVQSYTLLLYSELNYLAVHGHGRLTVLGYAATLIGATAVHLMWPRVALIDLILASIAIAGLVAVYWVRAARRFGLHGELSAPWVYFLFPLACGAGYRLWGVAAAVAASLAYLGYWWSSDRRQRRALHP